MLGTDASISLTADCGGLCPLRNVLAVHVTHLKGHPPHSESQYFEVTSSLGKLGACPSTELYPEPLAKHHVFSPLFSSLHWP